MQASTARSTEPSRYAVGSSSTGPPTSQPRHRRSPGDSDRHTRAAPERPSTSETVAPVSNRAAPSTGSRSFVRFVDATLSIERDRVGRVPPVEDGRVGEHRGPHGPERGDVGQLPEHAHLDRIRADVARPRPAESHAASFSARPVDTVKSFEPRAGFVGRERHSVEDGDGRHRLIMESVGDPVECGSQPWTSPSKRPGAASAILCS